MATEHQPIPDQFISQTAKDATFNRQAQRRHRIIIYFYLVIWTLILTIDSFFNLQEWVHYGISLSISYCNKVEKTKQKNTNITY